MAVRVCGLFAIFVCVDDGHGCVMSKAYSRICAVIFVNSRVRIREYEGVSSRM